MEELVELEEAGWQALSDGSATDFYDRLLADDALMLFPGGLRLDRAAVLAAMGDAPPWCWFRLEGFDVRLAAADAAVVTYSATAQREGDVEYHALMSSVYVRRDGDWRLFLHQHTPR